MAFLAKFQIRPHGAPRAPIAIFLAVAGCFGGDLDAGAQDAGAHLVDGGDQGDGDGDSAIVSPVGTGGDVDGSGGLIGAGGADGLHDAGPDGGATCDCGSLPSPTADRDGAELPRCGDGLEQLLTPAGYACEAAVCAPVVDATACPNGCIPADGFFGLPPRCRSAS